MVVLPFAIGTTIVVTVLLIVAGFKGVQCFIRDAKKQKFANLYTEEAEIIEKDAASMYVDVCKRKQVSVFQNNIDLALLLSLMQNADLSDTDINTDTLSKIIGYIPEKEEASFLIRETMKARIEELFKAEFGETTSPINFQTIAIALEKQSSIIKEITKKTQYSEVDKEDTFLKKEVVFYEHNYPADETVATLKKKKSL